MTEEMDRAAEAFREARANYEVAEHNLAAARASLTKADRRFHEVWGKALCNPLKVKPVITKHRTDPELDRTLSAVSGAMNEPQPGG